MSSTHAIQNIFSNPIKLLIVTSVLFLFLLTIGLSYLAAISYAQDKVALNDISLIQKYLKQYQADNQFYPNAVNGQPASYEKYLSNFPVSATTCPGTQNKYVYESVQSGTGYKLSFCLNHSAAGLHSGLNSVSP